MSKLTEIFSISKALLEITERDVTLLDQEVSNGEGWESYNRGEIINPTVLYNKLSAIFHEQFQEYTIEVQINGAEISTKCSCGSYGKICKHVVALLFSWVSDSDGFINVGNSLHEFQKKDKTDLLHIIARIFIKNPQNIFLLNGVDPLDDDYDDAEGLLN